MNRVTPQMRRLARRLIVQEQKGKKAGASDPLDLRNDWEKLRPPLAALMGNGGFHAILSRSLALASAEVPGLATVEVKADGTLAHRGERHAPLNAKEALEGRVVLLAQMLNLLVAFIGQDLTLRLVRDVWPKVSLKDLDLIHTDKNGKEKY